MPRSRLPAFRSTALRSTGLVGCLLLAGAASAQDFDTLRRDGATREGGRVGLALVAGPAYKGSDDRRVSLLPGVEYRWANGWFAGVGSGVGYEFLRSDTTTAGVRLTPDFGRKESRSDDLRGMGDVRIKPEIGVYLNRAVLTQGLALHGEMRYGAGGSGLLAELGASYGMPLAPQWRLRFGATTTLANDAYMQTYFGVTPEQSVSTGRYAPYEAEAGVRDTKLSATVLHLISRDWAVTGTLSASTLHSDAAGSPLTRQRTNVGLLLAVGTSF